MTSCSASGVLSGTILLSLVSILVTLGFAAPVFSSADGQFDATAFGAVPNEDGLDTAAVRKAIDTGAVLRGSTHLTSYPVWKSESQGRVR